MGEVEQDARKVRLHIEKLYDWAGTKSSLMPESDLAFIRGEITTGLDRLIDRSLMLENTPMLRSMDKNLTTHVNTVVLDMRDGTTATFETLVSINDDFTERKVEAEARERLKNARMEAEANLAQARTQIITLEAQIANAPVPGEDLREELKAALAAEHESKRVLLLTKERLAAEEASSAELRRRLARATTIVEEALPANAEILALKDEELAAARHQVEQARRCIQEARARIQEEDLEWLAEAVASTKERILECLPEMP